MSLTRINLIERALGSRQEIDGAVRQGNEVAGSSFSGMLEQSMKTVNNLQLSADDMTNRFALGDVEDVSEVVLAVSEAENALRLFVEVRNKLVDAYQQIARMPV